MKFEDLAELEIGYRFQDVKGCKFVNPDECDYDWFYGRKIDWVIERTFVLGLAPDNHYANIRLLASVDEYGRGPAIEVSVEDLETGLRTYAHACSDDVGRISYEVDEAGVFNLIIHLFES